jgi:2-polyprenyl-6-methoxyphenol hydroxylase-like FAD-dependent oxidoreductase
VSGTDQAETGGGGNSRQLRVGIVGGSIAGCLTAIELRGWGHDVTVFEHSHAELKGLLGAGLGTPTPMFRTMLERGHIGHDLPHLNLEHMEFVGRRAGSHRGHVALRLPLIFVAFHWGDFYRRLRAQVPDDIYLAGRAVASVSSQDGGATIQLEDGTDHEFDLVVAADGYRSDIRRDLFPDSEPAYCGYVCWRGVMDEREMEEADLMHSTFARFGCEGMPGSFLYPVTGADGSVTRGKRLINWGCYVKMPPDEVDDFFVDREGRRHDGTIPPGHMRPEHERRFAGLARESLPPYYADIVTSSRDTFAQEVFSAAVPDYHAGRICLTGDAGAVAPPFTGSGIFKAASNAIDLGAALDAHDDVDAALASWGGEQAAMAAEIIDLGRQYDRAFMDVCPDFGAMDTPAAAEWLARSITDPEGFTFVASTDGSPSR